MKDAKDFAGIYFHQPISLSDRQRAYSTAIPAARHSALGLRQAALATL